jgi:hypothetical protein
VSAPDDLRRLSTQSRVRTAAVEDLREQCRSIVAHSRRRLEESRVLLDRRSGTGRV